MDASRFDALSRAIAVTSTRRPLLRAISGSVVSFLLAHVAPQALAACRHVGARCHGSSDCCKGARCRHGKCRCKQGWTNCNQEGLCRQLSTDPDHCGACGNDCDPPCCFGGACQALCKDACCADCFVEADGVAGPPHPGTEFCCDNASVCSSTADPADDLCCWPDEDCIDGSCCCDGCLGTKTCGGQCCPAASCCNGKCCDDGQVCARPNPKKPRKCVAADRTCTVDDDCFAGEECRGEICCSGDRLCFELGPGTDPFCCPVGEYCDPVNSKCCANGKSCGTSKKVRIRP